MVAVDPEGAQFGTPEAVARPAEDHARRSGQPEGSRGPNPNPAELERIGRHPYLAGAVLRVRPLHDDELADAIMAVHHTINGWSRNELVGALDYWRKRGEDIKRVWESGRWDEQRQSRPAMGARGQQAGTCEALWPVWRPRSIAAGSIPRRRFRPSSRLYGTPTTWRSAGGICRSRLVKYLPRKLNESVRY